MLMLLLPVRFSLAQKARVNVFSYVDKKALELPDSLSRTTEGIAHYVNATFKSDEEKVRAIFIWTASAIQYDLQNMFAINFYEKKAEKIAKALNTRKGVCENYAAVFNDVCIKSGIRSMVIEGYTRQKGFTDYIPHAWCAAVVGGTWYMFDPTWASGYVNGGKFYKRINNAYFKMAPAALIKSHMPFDYLWQLLEYPVSSQEFYEGKVLVDKTKPYFNYIDSIRAYEQLSYIDQLAATARRIEKNGMKNSMIFDRLQHIRMEIENYRISKENEQQQQITDLYNSAVNEYNEGVSLYNKYVHYWNKQFIPAKTDAEIRQMIDLPDTKIRNARNKLSKITSPNARTASLITQLTQSLDDVNARITEQLEWLKLYLSKSGSKRKAMFLAKE